MDFTDSFANVLVLITCVLAGVVLLVSLLYAYIYFCLQSHRWRNKTVHAMDASSVSGGGGDNQTKGKFTLMKMSGKKKKTLK